MKEKPEAIMAFWHEDGVGWPTGTPQPFGNKQARKSYLEDLIAQTDLVSFEIKPGTIKKDRKFLLVVDRNSLQFSAISDC